jgi:hypothetical protein
MILDHGELISYGDIDEIADEYQQILEDHWGETLEARRARKRKKRLEKQARADERLRKLEERKKENGETRDERTV